MLPSKHLAVLILSLLPHGYFNASGNHDGDVVMILPAIAHNTSLQVLHTFVTEKLKKSC